MRSRFVDGLYALSAQDTKVRLSDALKAAKHHAEWCKDDGQREALERAISQVQTDLLAASRKAVETIDAAIRASLPKPTGDAVKDITAELDTPRDTDAPAARAPVRPVPPLRGSLSTRNVVPAGDAAAGADRGADNRPAAVAGADRPAAQAGSPSGEAAPPSAGEAAAGSGGAAAASSAPGAPIRPAVPASSTPPSTLSGRRLELPEFLRKQELGHVNGLSPALRDEIKRRAAAPLRAPKKG
jgi:hypothetical protein